MEEPTWVWCSKCGALAPFDASHACRAASDDFPEWVTPEQMVEAAERAVGRWKDRWKDRNAG
jgi:hypothetical protein